MITGVYLNNQSFQDNLDNYFEKNYLSEILKHLEIFLKDLTDDIEIYFYINIHNTPHIIRPINTSTTKVCIIIDEYLTENESLLKIFNYVFQAYLVRKNLPERYFHFPLGYGRNFNEGKYRKIKDRSYDIFFSGNLHKGRKKFFRGISKLSYLPFFLAHRIQGICNFCYDNIFDHSYIRFTQGFSNGLTKEDYSAFLYNSKIALCPAGIANAESFRLYEALKAGCIVISDKLPEKLNLEKSPIIQVDDWTTLKKVIKNLYNDPEEMQNLSEKTYDFFYSNFSGKAVAESIYYNVITEK